MITFSPLIMKGKKHPYVYTMDTFHTLADGTRTVDSTGTKGESADAVLHTGHHLDTNGVNQKIITDYFVKQTAKTMFSTLRHNGGAHNGFGCGNDEGGIYTRFYHNFRGETTFRVGFGTTKLDVTVPNTLNRTIRIVSTLRSDGKLYLYFDGILMGSGVSPELPCDFVIQPLHLCVIKDQANDSAFHNGTQSNISILTSEVSEEDILYDFNKQEAIINVALGNEDDNFSFVSNDIEACFHSTEGTGTVVHNIV